MNFLAYTAVQVWCVVLRHFMRTSGHPAVLAHFQFLPDLIEHVRNDFVQSMGVSFQKIADGLKNWGYVSSLCHTLKGSSQMALIVETGVVTQKKAFLGRHLLSPRRRAGIKRNLDCWIMSLCLHYISSPKAEFETAPFFYEHKEPTYTLLKQSAHFFTWYNQLSSDGK